MASPTPIVAAAATVVVLALAAATSIDVRPRYALRLVAVDQAAGGDATIAPDGRRFVTTSRRTGDWELWAFDLDTSQWSQITSVPGEDFEAKWSPDGHRLAFTSTRDGQKDIWTIDLRTREQRRLTSSPDDDEYPAWSPDGRSIVYTGGPWNRRDFFVVSATDGTSRRISTASGRAGACTFDPSGDTVVCHRYDAGSGDVVRLWIADGTEAPLTAGSPWDYKPSASPDGRLVAFSRAVEGPSHIWLMPAAGGRPWRLTGGAADDRWPTWSGDSKRILFHRAVDESLGVERLERLGTQPPSVLVPAAERPLQASLHPSGESVAYCTAQAAGRRVRIRDLTRGTDRTIDTGEDEACYPRWSPSGDRLALTVRHDDRWEVAVVDSDGRGLRLLTEGRPDLRGMDGPIDWSPDGSRLVFHADTEPFDARLFTVDVASGSIIAVTSPGFFDEAPSWSHDGREILFMSTRGGNWTWTLYRHGLQTGITEAITASDWVEKNYPRASARGDVVWTAVDDAGVPRVMERRGGTEGAVGRAGAGARWPAYSSDGRYLTYTRLSHRIEFWMIEHPTGIGAPHDAPSTARSLPLRGEPPSTDGESPHGFHRR